MFNSHTYAQQFSCGGSRLKNVLQVLRRKVHNLSYFRHGAYAIDQDERDKGSWKANVWAFLVGIMRNRLTPMPILVREVLEQDGLSYDQAAHILQTTPQVSDGYFMIVGTRPGEGMVITRNRKNTADVWTLDKSKGRWYILETNYDHWGPPGDKRRETAERLMNMTGPNFTAKAGP